MSNEPFEFVQDDGFEIIKKSLTTSHLEGAFAPDPEPEPELPRPPVSADE